MQWFHDRGTSVKLLGSSGLICAIMGVVGWMGVNTAQRVKGSLNEVGTT